MEFNDAQKEVISTVAGNISVIAAAGSGKTTILTNRIKNMVENHNIPPSSILGVTFSKKAKEAIIDKLKKLGIEEVNVETFHSLALKIILSKHGGEKYKVWSVQWEKEKFIQDICIQMDLCTIDDLPYNDIVSFIALQKVNMRKPEDELIYPPSLPFEDENMCEIYKLYEKAKEARGYIEFDDFLNLANDILDFDSDLLNSYRNKFRYILSDEFQDISMSQALLLKKLNTENTMIVGDPLQAIYSFRGGHSNFILNFDSDYPDTKVINLNINYRCSKDIIKTANALAGTLPDSTHKNYKPSVAYNASYKAPELYHFTDEYDEAKWISEKILQIKGEYKLNDIAILSRTNAQLQKIETALHDKLIPFEVVNGKLFTDLPEIKLLVSYLKLAIHENDNEAYMYLYNKPNRWLSKKFLDEVTQNSVRRNLSMYNAMFSIDRRNWKFKNGIDEIHEVINYLQNKKFKNVGEMVHYLRERLNIDTFVTKGKQNDDGNYLEQIENMNSFENMCEKFKSSEQLFYFLDEMNKEATSSKEQKVKLLTIHKSKGLEFPVVFIIGCSNGLLPHYKNQNIDDEARLLYVAITRAEKELFISYIDCYNSKLVCISPFIERIKHTVKKIEVPIIKNI